MRRKDREIADMAEIKKILECCKTCYVAMVDNAAPYVVPMSYGYALENETLTLYLHSAKEGRKIDILTHNPSVCFAVATEGEPVFPETPCNSGYYFSSVIGDGEAVLIEDTGEKCAALACLFKHQSGKDVTFSGEQANAVCVFKIVSKSFSGKKKEKPAHLN